MAEFKTVLSYPIKNNGLTSGVLDDSEVIGGYKIVQTLDDLENLKWIETVELEETETQDWKPRKHILKNGTLVYVEENGTLYRWKELASVTDENGIPHATDGEWIEEEHVHTVDENGVLCMKRAIDVKVDESVVTRQEFNETVQAANEALERLSLLTESNSNEIIQANKKTAELSGKIDEKEATLNAKIASEIKAARKYADDQITQRIASGGGSRLPALDDDGVLSF